MHTADFTRVIVTGDLLRPWVAGHTTESATWKNIRWLYHLLVPALADNGLETKMLAWDENGLQSTSFFDTPSLYYGIGMQPTLNSWAAVCNEADAPDWLMDAVSPYCKNALVVGYEMPPVIIATLNRLGVPYIDLVLHPLRFMSDLIFAMRTNVEAFHNRLEAHWLPETDVRQQAGRIMARAAWLPKPEPMPPGSALLLGQVASDRAMVTADGSMASLDQYAADVHNLCCDHSLVLFRPHPYAGPADPFADVIRRFPAVRFTNSNFYQLISQPEVDSVVALNSSGLLEARYFDCEAVNLIPFVYDFSFKNPAENGSVGSLIALDARWTTPVFWRHLLTGHLNQAVLDRSMMTLMPDMLRTTMNASWGYSSGRTS